MTAVLVMSNVFDREKTRVLEKADLSRKGSVDAPIRGLVEAINAHSHHYTTSSCSGRTVVFHEVSLNLIQPLINFCIIIL